MTTEHNMNTTNTASNAPNLVLVLGATGKTGRRVAQRLTAKGVPVRKGSRNGTPPFDWDDQTTWADWILLRDVNDPALVRIHRVERFRLAGVCNLAGHLTYFLHQLLPYCLMYQLLQI